jgi:hypothetical protein
MSERKNRATLANPLKSADSGVRGAETFAKSRNFRKSVPEIVKSETENQ